MKQDLPKKISLFAEQVAYILLYMLAAEGNIGSPYEVGVFFFFLLSLVYYFVSGSVLLFILEC